jgi:hypothetical protein
MTWHRIDDPKNPPPANVRVKLGGWSVYCGQETWREEGGVAVETYFFGLFRRECHPVRFDHWMPLPPPPGADA